MTFVGLWDDHPPTPDPTSLELGSDGSFQVRCGDKVTPLDVPGVVELLVQCILDESLWPRFAAYLPSRYPEAAPARAATPPEPPQASGSVTVPITFTAPAYGLLVAVATYDGRTVEEAILQAVAGNIAAFCSGMKEADVTELVLTGKMDFNREGA